MSGTVRGQAVQINQEGEKRIQMNGAGNGEGSRTQGNRRRRRRKTTGRSRERGTVAQRPASEKDEDQSCSVLFGQADVEGYS